MSNLTTIQDRVREEVKESIMKVLPQEVVDEIVKKTFETEIKTLMEEEIKQLFFKTYRDQVSLAAQELFNSQETSDAVKNMMESAGKSFFQGMIQTAMSDVMNDFQQKLYNRGYNY